MKQNTKYLTSIRGLACIMVLIAHILSIIPGVGANVSGCGKIGVWLFFVLSAFLLTVQWIDKPEIKFDNVIEFYSKRFFRIFPCYIEVLIIAFVLGYITSFGTFIKHVFLLEGIGHFWTIPVEFAFYIIVPFLMVIIKKIKDTKKSILFLIFLVLITGFISPYWKYEENSINLIWYLPVFFMGMITAFLYKHFENKTIKNVGCDILIVGIMIGMIVSIPYFRKLIFGIEPDSYLQNKYLYFGLAWSVIILAMQNSKYIKNYLNNSKILLWVGNISFPLYLIHYIIMYQIRIQNAFINSITILGISVILAVITNKFIEQPMIKLCKNINNKFLKKEKENVKV